MFAAAHTRHRPAAVPRQPVDQRPRTAGHGPEAPRAAFTLVELLMVVVIISILLALVIPAVSSVMRSARDNQVRTEIATIESAIATFKATFGVEPPSQITLCTNLNQWNNFPESRAAIRRIWPRFDFSGTGGLPPAWFPNGEHVTLFGDECLVFFLGGIRAPDPNDATLLNGPPDGFSSDPAHPFRPSSLNTPNEVRKGPFLDFEPARLVQSQNSIENPSLKGPMQVYLDPQAARSGRNNGYMYINSEGRSYPSGHFPPNQDPETTMQSIYLTPGGTPHKPKGFQIIAPGADGIYGTGGPFDPANPDGSLGNREAERDNITNFHGGRLAP